MKRKGELLKSVPLFLATEVEGVEKAIAVVARVPEFERLPVKWNSRLRTCAGRLTHTRTFPHEPVLVELNPRLKANAAELRETVLHELGHALSLYREIDDGHGPIWQSCVRELGGTPTRLHHYASVPRRIRRAKKIISACLGCGTMAHGRQYLSQRSRYRCLRCGETVLTDRTHLETLRLFGENCGLAIALKKAREAARR